jgi:hypothetical protein
MPDISMCMGSNGTETYCPLRQSCYRFKARPSEYRQSYFTDAPFIIEPDGVSCEYFWKLEVKNENK